MRQSLLILVAGFILLAAGPAAATAWTAPPERRHTVQDTPALTPRQAAPDANAERKPSGVSALTVAGALALVLGVFFLGVWLFRQTAPAGFGALPAEAFESLGRARLTTRHQVHLLRCGDKVLLVAVGAAGVEPLTEITSPDEVERLVKLCRQSPSGRATTALRQAFSRGEGDADG